MHNWERSEFDEQWKDAFAKAEVAPAPSVWTSLDHELTLAEGEDDKRRVIFYQRLAAACLLFALLGGSFGVYHWKQNENQIAQANTTKGSENSAVQPETKAQLNATSQAKADASQNVSANQSATTGRAEDAVPSADEQTLNSSQGAIIGKPENKQTAADGGELMIAQREETAKEKEVDAVINQMQEKQLNELFAVNTDLPQPGLLPIGEVGGEPRYEEIVRKLPYIPASFMAKSKKEKFNHEKLWASVSAASGAFAGSGGSTFATLTPGSPLAMNSSPSASAQGPATASAANNVGKSYSYGVIGGVRLARRWVLQTGIQYLNQSSESSAYNVPVAFSFGGGSVVNTNEFVSVPVQAGYLLIDRKIGFQLNPGLATDFFVKNTMSSQQQSVSQSAGNDSPYRSVNFAGLMSSEVSYKLGKNYRLSLVPGLRYSLNSALKSQATGNLLMWDVGFRFRYIFK